VIIKDFVFISMDLRLMFKGNENMKELIIRSVPDAPDRSSVILTQGFMYYIF